LHWQFICLHDTKIHSAQEPGSLYWCRAVMTCVRSLSCRGRLQNWQADWFIVGLYCVTITRQQIFKGSVQVTTVASRRFAACECWTQTSWQVVQRDGDCQGRIQPVSLRRRFQ